MSANRFVKSVPRTLATFVAMLATTLLIGFGTASTANAGVVPNMFWRTCGFGCSAYKQSNGPYNPNYISRCYTKNIFGQVTSYYDKWGRC